MYQVHKLFHAPHVHLIAPLYFYKNKFILPIDPYHRLKS